MSDRIRVLEAEKDSLLNAIEYARLSGDEAPKASAELTIVLARLEAGYAVRRTKPLMEYRLRRWRQQHVLHVASGLT